MTEAAKAVASPSKKQAAKNTKTQTQSKSKTDTEAEPAIEVRQFVMPDIVDSPKGSHLASNDDWIGCMQKDKTLRMSHGEAEE